MGILGRLGALLKSNTNAALDAAEDPRKQLDQAVADLEEQRRQAARAQLEVATALKLAQKQLAGQRERAEQLQRAAVAAVTQGKDDVARAALTEKDRVDGVAAELEKGIGDQQHALADLGESLQAMDRAIAEARGRRDELQKRLARAEMEAKKQAATTPGAPGKDHLGDTSAFDTYARMSDRIDEDEARAEAQREMAGGGSVEDRLAALKAKADKLH